MGRFLIEGGKRIVGNVEVCAAKNCVLVLMAAAYLCDEPVVIKNCPSITDVYNMRHILECLGCKTEFSGGDLRICASGASGTEIPQVYAKEIRSSIIMLGAILGRFRMARAVFPGGCDIGLRPIDLHLNGFRRLSVDVTEQGGYINCDGKSMRGAHVVLDFPSVGATENLILCSVLVKGETVIENAAKEPEVSALADMLNRMGAKISGIGTSTIRIVGVKRLHGVTVEPIPDRIVAGTYLLATAITNGEITLRRNDLSHLGALVAKMDGFSCDFLGDGDFVHVVSRKYRRAVKSVSTGSYPAFPTDLQAPFTSLQCVSRGVSVITENVFETRFKHVPELIKMGADIVVNDRTATVRGVKRLHGATVKAHDLRCGAALVLAALNAEGCTIIEDIRHIDRGYESLETALSALNAYIKRV